MNGLIFRPLAAALSLILLATSTLAASAEERVLITEFMASNTSGLRDEDGAFSDWIELFNAGTNAVNLNGWYLTDRTNDLTQWSFPATNIEAGAYLIVFASGKDRKTIGAPLHTSFGLSSGGEYLALIKPDPDDEDEDGDGVTIASEYRQQASQVANVSFGLAQSVRPQMLVTNDSPAAIHVPTDGNLALTWTTPDFDDAEWLHELNAIGFDTGAAQPGEPHAQTAHRYTFDADTADDSVGTLHGTPTTTWSFQAGRSGGRAVSLNGTTEAISFPSNDFTGNFTLEFWIRPARKLGAQTLLANTTSGFNSNGFRFYFNDLNTSNGIVVLESANGTNGATTKSQTSVDFDQWNHLVLTVDRTAGRARMYKNGVDITHPTTRALRMDFRSAGPWQIGQMLNSVNSYQGLIDHCAVWEGLLEASQIAALAAGAPSTNLTVFGPLIQTDIRPYMHNQNASAFIRLPFQITDPSSVSSLKLNARRDDGFVAYINGVEIARRNAPSFALGGTVADSQTEFSGTQGQNGWHYGYYNKTTDNDGIYQLNNFTPFPANYWNGAIWNWPAGDPPWTELTATGGHPNGLNNTADHWAVRRWESDVTGTLTLSIALKKGTTGGSGITGRILHNGVQKYSRTIAGGDTNGATTNVIIPDVIVGDFIDFAIDSLGTDNQINDSFDGTIFTARIDQQASPPLEWNSTAFTANPNSQGTQFEEIDLFGGIRWLDAGANMLAVHALNVAATNSDFFFEAELEGGISTALDPSAARYFIQPTPGGPNGTGLADLGPVILNVTHSPAIPIENEQITVTARITPSFGPIASNTLFYRVMFGPEVPIAMLDNGMNGDGIAGDGVFGARIPGVGTNGLMIRWYVRSIDTTGRVSRWPFYQDPNNSPQYLGTMVDLPQTNNLPILHWFVQNAPAAATDAGTRCSLFYLGDFYDNCYINIHGQSSRDVSFLRKPYDIDFNPGYHFRWDPDNPDEARVDDINLLQTYSDKAKMRNMLAHGTYKDAGSPYHYVVPVRVQQNGVYYADYHIVENGDAGYLERIGRDPNGALYKMYNTFTTAGHATIGSGSAEKKTRRFEGNADLLALFNGVTSATNRTYIYDNINIAEALNSIGTRALTADLDCCHKNYYFYRNSTTTGEWECHPWDVDLSFGRNWTECSNYWGDNMHPENGLLIGGNNGFFQPLFAGGTLTRQMYYRRIRTLMDELLQAPGTPVEELKYEAQIDHWVEKLAPDADLEKTRWATWGNCASPATCCTQTVAHAAALIKTNFLPEFRRRIFNRINANTADIPNSQPTNAVLVVAGLDFNPASGNQLEEYIQIRNTNLYAVDISGWKLWSGIPDPDPTNLNLIHTFQGGVVIPATNSVYVVPNKRAFRARAVAPRGGMQLYVEGEYDGQLSARGELIELTDKLGHKVISTNYPGNPTPAQLYLRITEIMYHPALLTGNPNGPEEFEYIELKNISTTQTISLTGVRFVNGITFNFNTGSITSLGPLQRVLLVKNLAAFTARYGSGLPIAGVYGGNLDNAGERIRLDEGGEKVLDFEYNNSWYPTTDGLGFSLVIVNENAPFHTWDRKASWRPSGGEHGSPGQNDPAPFTVSPVLINELVSNSDTPPTDMIELYNPNTNDVNIGGWLLSDDFLIPRKYRIPAGTIIRAGSYMTFDESQFNSNPFLPTSFAFSSDNDEAYIFSADSNTNLTGFFHGFNFGASDPDVSFGRYLTSTTNEEFVAQSQRTFGTNNAYPRVGPVVITEIMYHPPDRAGGQDNSDEEYIELYNLSATNVALYDSSRPSNTWQLRDAVEFAFPRNVTLGPSNFLLVVSFNPAEAGKLSAFRTRYGLDASVPVYGPYNGKLDNSSDSVGLYRPAVPTPQRVPYVRLDKVEYEDRLPWPESADGIGPALQRLDSHAYGNDPINWDGGLSPGARPGGTPPQITEHPLSQTVLAGTNITLTASATGTSPLIYQWRRNGASISGGNGNTLAFINVKPSDAGNYDVIVFNPAGSAQSSNAVLNVLVPLKITGQPGHVNTNVGATARFSVAVSSPRAVTYQWRKNDVDIPGATAATYTISGVSRDDEGEYTAFVQDAVSSEISAPARLIVLVPPRMAVQPRSATVVAGTDVSFTGAVSNTANPMPLTFRWRRDSSFFTNVVSNSFSHTYTILNVRTNDAATYTLIVTNMAGATIGLSSNAYLIVVVPPTNQIVSPGTNVTIVARVGAPRNSRFQWQFGGSNIVNATNLSLTVTNVQAADTGTYTLVVYNPTDTDATAARFPVEIQFASLNARFSESSLGGDGFFRAMIEGAANRTYSVEFSTDMTNWTELRSIVMTNSSVQFVDEGATNATQKFYRARLAD